MQHPFWGDVQEDWVGFSGTVVFAHPFFEAEVPVFLGEENAEDPAEDGQPPTTAQLDDFAATYQEFLAQLPKHLAALQQQTFDYYTSYYAGFYEDTARSGELPLGIRTVAQHNAHIRELLYLRVTADGTLRIPIQYALDPEHGLEAKFVHGKLVKLGGIDDT